jgi:hypothetical protein
MTVNRTNLMKAAWAKTRALGATLQRMLGALRAAFAQMLKEARAEAKAARPAITKEQAAYGLFLLMNKDNRVLADYQRSDEFNAVLRAA